MQTGHRSIQTYLISRSQAGDRKAQNELYKLYAAAMYNICRRMMGDDDEAKDVLQDTFIDAFMKIDTLKNPETFPAWIKRITINHCINTLNRKERMVMQAAEVEDNAVLEDVWSIDLDDRDIKIKKIMQALDRISAGCRTVFNLYLFEGYDHKEIGEILSITESASKAQYSKAKMKIRKQLEEQRM